MTGPPHDARAVHNEVLALPRKIILTRHVRHRVRQRLPRLVAEVALAGGKVNKIVRTEVLFAIEDGRVSSTPPDWLNYDRAESSESVRYVWNAAQTRVYVVARLAYEREIWKVLTVLRPRPATKAAAA